MLSAGRVRGVVAVTLAAFAPAAGTAIGEHSALQSVQLPAPAAVGQEARTDAVIQTTIEGGPISLHVMTSSAVTDVDADGSYTAESVIDLVAVTNAPASADVATWGFDTLEGGTFERTYAATGAPTSQVSRSANAQSVVLESLSMVSVGFPSHPVAVGDSWSVQGQIVKDGLTFDVTYKCRLAAVANGSYSVDVSYAEGFNAPAEHGVAEGTISGTGTLNGSLGNPLVVWGGMNQTIDGVLTGSGTATTMRLDTSVSLSSVEGWSR